MVFGTVDLAHYEKSPLHQRHLKKNSGTLDLWMFVGPFAGVTPLARFKKDSLVLRAVAFRGLCFVTLVVPNQFRYPV
jgi:hypothetical protein